jgi:hypothetical protein
MKKRVTLVLALCALALAIPLSAVAGNAPKNKVTGDMSFNNPTFGWANFKFSGHDGGASADDKGTATYTDMHGSWTGTATDVVVGDGTATMTVLISSSTHYAVQAPTSATFTFYDTGEAGTSDETSDYFTTVHAGPHYTAEAGNIQIHYSI